MVKEKALNVASSSSSSTSGFPSPVVYEIKEGSYMERHLLCLLSPSHKDHFATQIYNFPQLKSLTPSELVMLRKKFIKVDEQSYNEWYHLLFASTRSVYV